MQDGSEAIEASHINAAVAGNPRTDEPPDPTKHTMKKSQTWGRDIWRCTACEYNTFVEKSAREHEKNPK